MIHVEGLRYTHEPQTEPNPHARLDTDQGSHLNSGPWSLEISQLSIAPGERVAIMGPSGSGKSTLIALLSGLALATEGVISVNQRSLHKLTRAERTQWRHDQVGLQSEITRHRGALSSYEYLDLDYWIGLAPSHDTLRVDQTLERLGLTRDLARRSTLDVSQGEQLRFAIARVCLSARPIMIFDEPTAHLDAECAERVSALLTTLPGEPTVIIATHDEALARRCDRVVSLARGSGATSYLVSGDEASVASRDTYQVPRETQRETQLTWWRSQYNRWRFAARHLRSSWRLNLLIGCAALITLAAPLSARRVTTGARSALSERATQTPLIIGAQQSPLDLFFSALYFSTSPRALLDMESFERLSAVALTPLTPLLLCGSARGIPLVATDSSYFERRGMTITRGRLPLRVGEIALSDTLAQTLSPTVPLMVGTRLSTELADLYQLTAPTPIELEVVGVLNVPQHADHNALFTTLATGWAALGFAHDHASRRGELGADEVISPRLTAERYHMHRDPMTLPLSALLAFPKSARSHSITRARLQARSELTVIEPALLSRDTLKFSERLERLLHPLLMALIALAAALTFFIIAQRHLERAPERHALYAVGVSRRLTWGLAIREYLLLALGVTLMTAFTLTLTDHLFTPEDLWRALSTISSSAP